MLSYAVTQDTNEIGVRMALGATSSEILLYALTLTGLAIGLVLSAIASRSMTALVCGFRPDHVPTITAVFDSLGGGGSGLFYSRAPCVAEETGCRKFRRGSRGRLAISVFWLRAWLGRLLHRVGGR